MLFSIDKILNRKSYVILFKQLLSDKIFLEQEKN